MLQNYKNFSPSDNSRRPKCIDIINDNSEYQITDTIDKSSSKVLSLSSEFKTN